MGLLDDAVASYHRALKFKPDLAEAHSNLGAALYELGQLESAMASFDEAIALQPDFPAAHWNKSLLLLLTEELILGFEEYEWRWQNENLSTFKEKREFAQPQWLGAEPLEGKSILLHSEQGLGDAIQFCRYATVVAGLGARVILEVPDSLIKLLTNLKGVSQLIPKGSPLPAFDYHCPLMSLPLAIKTTVDTIPSPGHYLKSDPAKVAQWQPRLGEKTRPRIGLVWSGNPMHKNDRNRSISLAHLRKVLPDHCQYVSLQKDLRDGDLHTLQLWPDLLHFGGEFSDYSDTAALCELMDVIISVDTSIAHLAGALGKKVWVLLPFMPDWRWLLNRTDSPWYPSATLYRQDSRRDWEGVFAKIKSDLMKLFQ